MRLLVTGAAGFIGTNFVRDALGRADGVERLVALDLLTYAGNRANLEGLEADPRFRFVRLDVAERAAVAALLAEERVDVVVHFAAETHVDRSIRDAAPFLHTNVAGTLALLEAARGRPGLTCLLHVSTDEVYGTIAEGRAREDWPLRPSSPYAASKAAADAFVQAYAATHGVPAVITRCANNYGPWQFPEKLIPLFVTNALDGRPLPLAPLAADLERDRAAEDAHRLLLLAVVLEAQGLAGAHVEDLADVALGARPDDLVPPGLGDVLGPDRTRRSRLTHRCRGSHHARRARYHSTVAARPSSNACRGRQPVARRRPESSA